MREILDFCGLGFGSNLGKIGFGVKLGLMMGLDRFRGRVW